MNPRRFDLLGIGECMIELHAEQPLGTTTTLHRAYGGDVLNALVACARLGGRCGFISRVGNDPFGTGLLDAWRSEGIDTAQAPLVPGDNGVYFISVAPDGEREFSYRRSGTAASQLRAEDLDEGYLGETHWLLLSGITQALSASARSATLAAARIARRQGVRIAYDPNYRPRLWAGQGGLKAAREAFREIAPYAEWLLPSHPADTVLLRDSTDEDSDAAFASARDFLQYSPHVALKCGAAGCIINQAARLLIVPGATAATVIDSTGAGDLWNGSFLNQLNKGFAAQDAATLANQLAADKLAHRGAIPPRPTVRGRQAAPSTT